MAAPFLATDGLIHEKLMMRWLERIPYPLVIVAALFMLGAPFVPEPHLIEKARMLTEGKLTRPLDIFDVVWHLAPALLLGLKFALARRRQINPGTSKASNSN